MSYLQKHVKLSNDITISYAEKGNENGIVLIMLHGLSDSYRAFEPILPYIPEDIHVFALTLRGHGDASHPKKGYRTKDFVEDLVLFMDELQIKSAIILGASSGGFIARSFAIKDPHRTSGLILLGAPSSLGDKQLVQSMWDSTISKLTDPIDPKFVREFTQNIVSRKISPDYLDVMFKENMKVPARVWKLVTKNLLEDKFPGRLAEIAAPTLIIWGENDVVVTREDVNQMIQIISQAKLISHQGLGHLLYWEDPELIANDVVEFINTL